MIYTKLQEVKKNRGTKDFRGLHLKAVSAVEKLKSCEAELIQCLQEVDDNLVHRFLGYNSLFQYAIKALLLSESQAAAYITVARKAKEFPALQAAVVSGELTVSKASRITRVIDERSQMKWIEMAKQLPRRTLEKEVATVAPRAVIHERARFLNANTLEMNLPISEENFKLLERVKDLVSSQKSRAITLEECLAEMAQFYIERKDPVEKAKRAIEKSMLNKVTLPGQCKSEAAKGLVKSSEEVTVSTKHSVNIESKEQKPSDPKPAKIRHQLMYRDQGKCQAKLPNGEICGERKWLEHHHIQPKSRGGADHLNNLITVCRAHHQAFHKSAPI